MYFSFDYDYTPFYNYQKEIKVDIFCGLCDVISSLLCFALKSESTFSKSKHVFIFVIRSFTFNVLGMFKF